MTFKKIVYKELNSRQKENYSFHQLAAVLVEYGFTTLLRLTDDWKGADLIAQHKDGKNELRIQLKGRISFSKKHQKKRIWIAFPDQEGKACYLYPHDRLLQKYESRKTRSWVNKRGYSRARLSDDDKALLKRYTLGLGT